MLPIRRPLVAAALVSALGLALHSVTGFAEQLVRSEAGPVKVSVVARGLETPWSLAFLPDGRMLVTERPGRMRIVSPSGELF